MLSKTSVTRVADALDKSLQTLSKKENQRALGLAAALAHCGVCTKRCPGIGLCPEFKAIQQTGLPQQDEVASFVDEEPAAGK